MVDYLDPSKLKTPASIATPDPTGPLAVPRMVRGEDGLMHTIYVDPKTGETLHDLVGRTIVSGGNYYKVTEDDDVNKDGKVNPAEAQTKTQAAIAGKGGAAEGKTGPQGKPGAGGLQHGYSPKPGWLGPASAVAGLVSPALGLGLKAASFGYNAKNATAVALGRQEAALPANGKQTAKGFLKDNKGQIADNVSIGKQDYSVGYNAMSPDNRTNLTPAEASKRAAMLGTTPKEQDDTTDDFSADENGTGKSTNLASKITGLQPGWASRALDKAFKTNTPEDATAPATSKVSTVDSKTARTTQNPTVDASGVGFTSAFGPNRPNMPDRSIVDAVKDAVGKTFGKGYSVTGISGEEDEGKQYGSTRHKTGLAMDFDVVDPSGKKVTDVNALNDMASQFAFDNPEAGIGFGKGYMAPGRMHLDITGQQKEWGAANTVANMDPALKETIDAARLGYQPTPFSNPGVPSARPNPMDQGSFVSQDERDTNTGSYKNAPDTHFTSQDDKTNTGGVGGYRSNFTSQDERSSMQDRLGITDAVGDSLSPSAHQSVMAPGPKSSVAQQTISNSVASAKLGTSPAAMAAMGFSNRTPEEKTAMARTIAGELSPSSLKSLQERDPKALAEFGSMVATMENRAASKVYSSIDDALGAPKQYSSLAAANIGTTNQNYSQYSAALKEAMDDYYAGKIAVPNYDVTSYVNPDLATPDWSVTMDDPAMVGEHLFGKVATYDPGKAARDAAKAMSTMAGTDFSPGKMKDDQSGFGYQGSGTSFGGSAGQSAGAGFSPGGMNSPSGSGFGGSSVGGGRSNNGTGTSSGGSAGMSGGGGYSPGGMGSPSGSGFGSPSSSGNNGGLGGPTSNNSGNSSGSKGIGGSSSAGNGWGGRSGSV